MKAFGTAIVLLALVPLSQADPGQVNMKPLHVQIRANSAVRDGSWLLDACEQHRIWDREPGTLWKGRDSSEENLGAGLCAGFVTGVLNAPGVPSRVAGRPFEPERILRYLRSHGARLAEPAGRLVVDAMLDDGT